MFCQRCGTKIPDDSVFCFSCGTPTPTVQQTNVPQQNRAVPGQPSATTSQAQPRYQAPPTPAQQPYYQAPGYPSQPQYQAAPVRPRQNYNVETNPIRRVKERIPDKNDQMVIQAYVRENYMRQIALVIGGIISLLYIITAIARHVSPEIFVDVEKFARSRGYSSFYGEALLEEVYNANIQMYISLYIIVGILHFVIFYVVPYNKQSFSKFRIAYYILQGIDIVVNVIVFFVSLASGYNTFFSYIVALLTIACSVLMVVMYVKTVEAERDTDYYEEKRRFAGTHETGYASGAAVLKTHYTSGWRCPSCGTDNSKNRTTCSRCGSGWQY